MNWEDISDNAREVMKELGNFGPTRNPLEALIKGYMACEEGDDGRTYYDPTDLHKIAEGCMEVALWLIHRKEAAQLAQQETAK